MTESENRVIPFKKAVHPWIFRNLLSEILHVYFMYANLTVVRPGDEMTNFTEKANMNDCNDELLLDGFELAGRSNSRNAPRMMNYYWTDSNNSQGGQTRATQRT